MACPSSTLAAQGSRQHARSCPPQAARNGTLARQAQVWGAWLADKQKGYLWNLNQAEVERTNGSAQQKFLGCRSFCSPSKCDGARNLKSKLARLEFGSVSQCSLIYSSNSSKSLGTPAVFFPVDQELLLLLSQRAARDGTPAARQFFSG